MSKNLKTYFICMFAACAVLTFANGKGENVAGDGPVKIKYYTWTDAVHKPLVDAFNASQNEIFVEAEYVPSADYEVKIMTLLSGKAEIDAYMQKRQADMFPHWANGFIEPLDAYFKKTGLSKEAVETYPQAVTVDGKIIAVPWRGTSAFTYYNKKVFGRAGVPTPDTYVKEGTWTWEKFAEVSEKLAKSGAIGSSIYFWASCIFYRSAQYEQDIITRDGKIQLDNSVLDYLKMRKDLEAKKAMWPLIDMKVTKTHYSKQFYDGNLGMLLIGEWFPGQMITGKNDKLLKNFNWEDYGITRLPCNVSTYHTWGIPTFNHVVSYSKKKEAAFRFIQWMSGPEARKVAASYGVLPAVVDDNVKSILAKNIPDAQSLKYFLEPRIIYPSNFSKYGSRAEMLLDSIQEEYLLGKIPDSELNAKIKKGLEEIIKTTD